MVPKQSDKILVVDGDEAVLDLIANQVLGPLGYDVATASDGATGLQQVLRLTPDLLVTALDLPGLSGRDLLAALRSQGYETTVIALGPHGPESPAMQAYRLGAKDFLAKPLREAELVASIDRALGEVRLRRERQQLADRLAGANQQLEKRIKELTTLASIGKAVTAITNLSQLFSRLLEAAMFVTDAGVGWLVLADGSGPPVLRAAKNLPSLFSNRLNQPFDDGISSLILLSGQGITLAGPPLAKLRAGQIVKAAVAAPLKARDQVIGVLNVGNRSGQAFTDRDLAMLSAVADYAVNALVNARLLNATEARAQAAEQAHAELMRAAERQALAAQRLVPQLREQLVQARAALDPLARGQAGALSAPPGQAVSFAAERLAAALRLLDEMPPARPAPAAEPATPEAAHQR